MSFWGESSSGSFTRGLSGEAPGRGTQPIVAFTDMLGNSAHFSQHRYKVVIIFAARNDMVMDVIVDAGTGTVTDVYADRRWSFFFHCLYINCFGFGGNIERHLIRRVNKNPLDRGSVKGPGGRFKQAECVEKVPGALLGFR